MKYELWDAGSGNIVGWYDSLDELVRAAFGLGQVNPDADPQEFVAATVQPAKEAPTLGWRALIDTYDPHIEAVSPDAVLALMTEVRRLLEAVETEWYNGNVDEGARDRILDGWDEAR